MTRGGAKIAPVFSLLFEAGAQPYAAAVRELEARGQEFSVSHDPAQGGEPGEGGWLELLVNGLTFDLLGLAPGPAQPSAQFRHRFDLPDSFEIGGCKVLALRPGPHIAGGESMLPVVRSQALLASRLCALQGLAAVGWAPARTLCSVTHFTASVRRWLEGGAFPALGLTALTQASDGGVHSEGLAFFTGQELRIEPELAADKAYAARLALRLINELVERERIAQSELLTGPEGELLCIAPSENRRFVRVRLAPA